jgi:hypothetical protein
MSRPKSGLWFVFLGVVLLSGCATNHFGGLRKSELNAYGEDSVSFWQSYIDETFRIGETRKQVERKLENMYLEKIELPFNSGTIYAVIYRVDDVTELYLEFNCEGDTLRKKLAIEPTLWIRNPGNRKALYVIDRKTGEHY